MDFLFTIYRNTIITNIRSVDFLFKFVFARPELLRAFAMRVLRPDLADAKRPLILVS
jgi:hypothetical protein